jgi:OOP family OmpA-OmpF porin
MRKTRNRLWMGLPLILAMAASPAVAQESGTTEIGVFGRGSIFDNSLDLTDWIGFGARAGYFFMRDLSVEADASYTRTEGAGDHKVSVVPIHARLIYFYPYGEQTHLFAGAGYVHTEYGADADGSGDGAGALVGVRYPSQEKLSFRLEATADWYADTDIVSKENHVDYGVQFGASLLFGGGPGDSDHDGVTDDRDRCPDTPRGARVDRQGCPLPGDGDGDGVTDDKDRCPSTPRGETVDASGCPLPKDSDGDGVTDDKDKCPGTRRGEAVDANGCPRLFEGTKTTLVLEGVNFATGKAELTPGSRDVLDRVAASLVANPEIKVEVAGHTDNTGSHPMNVKLSQARADVVRDYLVSKGVAAGRLSAKGYGPDKPIASNDTPEGRAKNRRTELTKVN